MRTNFLQKNRRHENNRQKIFLVVIIFLLGYGFFSLFNSSILIGVTPLWNLRNEIINKSQDFASFFSSRNSLVEENRSLKDKLAAEESLLYSYRTLETTNERLLQELGRLPTEVKVAAGVMMRPPQSLYDVLVIDAGSKEGIVISNQVILPFGVGLGTISKVNRDSSEVTLYTSYGIKTEAVLERGEVPVTLIGQGGGNFIIELPRDIPSEVGDRVLSYGLSPRLLGVVEEISAQSTDSFKRVLVKTPQSFYSLRFVYVLK